MKVQTWCVRSPQQWEQVVACVTGGEFAFDTEYEDRGWPNRIVVGMSLAWKADGKYTKVYVPLNHYQQHLVTGEWSRIPTQLTYEQIRSGLQTMIDAAPRVFMHNALADLKSLHKMGIVTADTVLFDTMIGSWLLWVDRPTGHGLKELTKKYFHHVMLDLGTMAPKETVEDMSKPRLKSGKNKGKYRTKKTGVMLVTRVLFDDNIVKYASEDPLYTLLLGEKWEPEIAQKGYTDVFNKWCMPQLHYLNEMEEVGMVIDRKQLKALVTEVEAVTEKARQEMFTLAEYEFNPKSNPQLNKLLFGPDSTFKITPKEEDKGSSGYYSTNKLAMKLYAAEGNEICQKITTYSKHMHLLSAIKGWMKRLKKSSDGLWRLYGHFSMHTTRTGRLSSNNPNLQNIPVRDKEYMPRKSFVAPKGFVFLDADFSQIELRLLAHKSQDERMVRTMNANGDIHVETAIIVYHLKPPKELDQAGIIKWVKEHHSEKRTKSKNVNFASIYGSGPKGLVLRFDIPLDEAQDFLVKHAMIFPGVYVWKKKMIRFCQKRGYVKTLLGRQRKLPDINLSTDGVQDKERRSYLWMKKGSAERMAVNTPIQGSAADLIGLAMIKIRKLLRASGDWLVTVFPAAQVHDELVWYVKKSVADRIKTLVLDTMRNVLKLRVPIDVEGDYGNDWVSAKP